MDELEMLPEWAGRKKEPDPRRGETEAPSSPSGDASDGDEISAGGGRDEADDAPSGVRLAETAPARSSEAAAVSQGRSASGFSGRWIAILAVLSLASGLAAGYVYLLIAG